MYLLPARKNSFNSYNGIDQQVLDIAYITCLQIQNQKSSENCDFYKFGNRICSEPYL